MITSDVINGAFEFLGSVVLWRNVHALYRDKIYKGVRLSSTAFFMAWGYWNLYYYPSLGQYWSVAGGVSIVAANTVWALQMVYYYYRNRGHA